MSKRSFAPGVLVRVREGQQVAEPMILHDLKTLIPDLNTRVPELNLTRSGVFVVEQADGERVKLKYFALTYRAGDFELAQNEETLATSL